MGKPKTIEEIPADAAPGEFGPITWDEFKTLSKDVQERRMKRAHALLMSLRGKIHLNIDTDELRGRNRR